MEEEKKIVRKPRQTRTPQLTVGKEVKVKFDKGVFYFFATLTTTIDSWGNIPIGRVNVPDGYALLVNGTEWNVDKHLIAPEQLVVGHTYLSLHCTNASPDLRRVYQDDVVAKGVLIKITDKVNINVIE